MSISWSELFPSVWSWEFLGFVTGILSVLLLLPTKRPRLQWTNWIFSIVSASVYLYLFREWKLYGNSILQVPFLLISLQGAWLWRGQLRGIVQNVKEIPITYARFHVWIVSTAIALLGMIIVFPVLNKLGDASPLWDGLILVISLAAIFLQLKKFVQSWYLWLLVDIIAVPFHLSQDRGATALLYGVYGIMCIVGYLTWRKEANLGQQIDRDHLDDRNEAMYTDSIDAEQLLEYNS